MASGPTVHSGTDNVTRSLILSLIPPPMSFDVS